MLFSKCPMLFLVKASLLFSILACSNKPVSLKADKYIITAEEDGASEKWATYLHSHLLKRTDDKSCAVLSLGKVPMFEKNIRNIHIEFAPELKYDYVIIHRANRLLLRFRNSRTAIWVTYQLIENIGLVDERFNTEDLPPAAINFSPGGYTFDFKYREPYFALNYEPDVAPLLGTNNVEEDWGLWGHNLYKIISGEEDETIYAIVKGERNRAQLCFSSEKLLKLVREYIIDNYGFGNEDYQVRMMIMPADNKLSCTCPRCIETGNTSSYASPAVQDFIRRLSEMFPYHYFYTSAYLTTLKPPVYQLPENSGVFFSTINLPKGVKLSEQVEFKEFRNLIEEWQTKTPNIYLWDYMANFDDYLTPLPSLLALQSQLKYFKALKIKGIFLNASGYDYSPFDELKTVVASALMMDVSMDIEPLIEAFFKKNYPQSHEAITSYYLKIEREYAQKEKAYNIYGGMRESMNSYFDVESFMSFYSLLPSLISSSTGEEEAKLQKLFTALTYTRLQVAYTQGIGKWGYAKREDKSISILPEISELVQRLEGHKEYKDMQNYKESGGSLDEYIEEWKNLLQIGKWENILLDTPIELISSPNNGSENTSLLNDGTFGFRQDYHQGWYTCHNKELHLRFSTRELEEGREMKIRFLHMPRHRFDEPETLNLLIDGKTMDISKLQKEYGTELNNNRIISYTLPIELRGSQSIELKFTAKGNSRLALDEIQIQ